MRLCPMPVRSAATTVAVAALALSLTACGGDGGSAGEAADTAVQPGGAVAGAAEAGRATPGASGVVAAIDGTTLQVQSPASGQVAVTYTDTTAFTAQVAAALGDVTAGSCVLVVPAEGSTDGADTLPNAVTASSVRIVPTEGEDCGSGPGGGPGGAGDEQRPGSVPSGMPDEPPSGRPSVGPGAGTFVRATGGTVTSLSSSGFTVEASVPGEDTTSSVEVTVTGTTTYTTTVASDASALAKGVCVTATGESDGTGAVTADEIGISDPVDGECTVGLAMRGGAA